MTYRLSYYSANRLSSRPDLLGRQIKAILETSRRNNSLAQISGALLFSEGYFGQVLEGPQAAIEATFERIQRDKRHQDIQLLDFARTALRSFENWSMAFVGERISATPDFSKFAEEAGLDGKALSGQRLFEKLLQKVVLSPPA